MKQLGKTLPVGFKLFALFIILLLLVETVATLFVRQHESSLLLQQAHKRLEKELDAYSERVTDHLSHLQKETIFLSKLEVMDDILAKDIDQRILTLLEQKSSDLAEGILLLITDPQGKVIIAPKGYLGLPIDAFRSSYLRLQAPLFTSFSPSDRKRIGTLWLLYPYRNLRNLHTENPAKKIWLQPPGHTPHFPVPDTHESLVVSKRLDQILKGWTIHLSYRKERALSTLHEIEEIQFYTFLFSSVILALLLWILSRWMTLPLIHLLRESQQSLEAKSTFLSTISHELRTPLGSILNLTQHLMLTNKQPKNLKMLTGIETAATHLLAMINNILQLSRLEAREIIVHKERVDLEGIIAEIIEITEPLMLEKGIAFSPRIDIHPSTITTDANLLKQVIINLLSNAIKFTDKGEIGLTLTNQHNRYRLTVEDSGIGIDRARLRHLFTPFYQAHANLDTFRQSSGLGLALSQKVARLLGGKITIESAGVGKGVTAIFDFRSL